MKRKYIVIFFLISIVCIAFTGYLKGCNSKSYIKQYPVNYYPKDSSKYIILSLTDSFVQVPAGEHYKRNKISELVYGDHYRNLWILPVRMKVFNIGKEKGGLTVLKLGGSMQTLNLRLEAKDGKSYVLRSVDKDQAKALPSYSQNKMLIYIIRDQTAAMNPYAALIIPKLIEPTGILHTNPVLFYIPYDPGFGEYANLFEGIVTILEEHPDKSWANLPLFKDAADIIDTEELLNKRFKFNDVQVDEKEFVKARLFDLLINDWDRHKDQWKWAEYKEDNKKIFKPIPRDRDIAFFTFDSGLIPFIVKIINPKFQSFDYNYKNIKGMIKNARYIDKLFINSITEAQFIDIAETLKKKLTDSVIESAVKTWPEEVYNIEGKETINKLKARRNKLNEAAKEYYQLLFKEVNVVGTDKVESFIVERVNDQFTSVIMKDENGEILYRHLFDHRITKEVSLYGLNGSDNFLIKGKTGKGIVIKIFGGEGYDHITDQSFVKGFLKKTKVYDTKTDNQIEFGEEAEDLTSYDPDVLYFNRTGKK